MKQYYTFEDVLIKPTFSSVGSRRNVDPSAFLVNTSGKRWDFKLPIISSNMETVTGVKMAKAIANLGGLAMLHRFCSLKDNERMFKEATENEEHVNNVGVSIGVSEEERTRADNLYKLGARIFCIDVANGAQDIVVDQAKWLKDKYEDTLLIVGNFATAETIDEFRTRSDSAADIFKVGIGPGAACLTREKTGVGLPQLSSVIECARAARIISDGGCKKPADICKALAGGASMVMLGSMLSGTTEAGGTTRRLLSDDGKTTVWEYNCIYRGSAAGGYAAGHKTSEGTSANIKYKGDVTPIVKDIEGGLRSSMSYVNAKTLEEYFHKTEFIHVTTSTALENSAHILNNSLLD